jgi:hypothetical protein
VTGGTIVVGARDKSPEAIVVANMLEYYIYMMHKHVRPGTRHLGLSNSHLSSPLSRGVSSFVHRKGCFNDMHVHAATDPYWPVHASKHVHSRPLALHWALARQACASCMQIDRARRAALHGTHVRMQQLQVCKKVRHVHVRTCHSPHGVLLQCACTCVCPHI